MIYNLTSTQNKQWNSFFIRIGFVLKSADTPPPYPPPLTYPPPPKMTPTSSERWPYSGKYSIGVSPQSSHGIPKTALKWTLLESKN